MTVNIVDVVLIALFAIFIIDGCKRGLILSLLGIIRAVIGIPVAYFASKYFCAPFYESYVHDAVIRRVSDSIENSGGVDAFLENAADGSEPLFSQLADKLTSLKLAQLPVNEAATLITDKLLEPVIMPALKLLLFFAALFVFYLITAIVVLIIKHFRKKDKTPLKTADRVLGAVFGAVKGAIVLVVICAFASVLVSINLPNENDILSSVEESRVINFINNENPFLDYLEG